MSSFEFDYQNKKLYIDGKEMLSGSGIDASNVLVSGHNTVSSGTLQQALEQLADQSFRSTTQPDGNNVDEGDIWYNPLTNNFYVYRETALNIFEWVPIMVGNLSANSDTLDGGAF